MLHRRVFGQKVEKVERSAMVFLQSSLISHVTLLPLSHIIRNFGLTLTFFFFFRFEH